MALKKFVDDIVEILGMAGCRSSRVYFNCDDIPASAIHKSFTFNSFSVSPQYLAGNRSDYAGGGTEAEVIILWKTQQHLYHQSFLDLLELFQQLEALALQEKSDAISIAAADISMFQEHTNRFYLILNITFTAETERRITQDDN